MNKDKLYTLQLLAGRLEEMQYELTELIDEEDRYFDTILDDEDEEDRVVEIIEHLQNARHLLDPVIENIVAITREYE